MDTAESSHRVGQRSDELHTRKFAPSGTAFLEYSRAMASDIKQYSQGGLEWLGAMEAPELTALIGLLTVFCWLLLRSRRRPATIVALYCFPVKSMRGIQLSEARLDRSGLQHDRRWMVVQQASSPGQHGYTIATAREFPRLTMVQPELTNSGAILSLTLPTGATMTVAPPAESQELSAELFRAAVFGQDQGDKVAQFLTQFLEADPPLRLMRCADNQLRDLRDDPKYAPALRINPMAATMPDLSADPHMPGLAASYTDWSPISIVSNQSLNYVNSEYGGENEIGHTQFRTNIVVDTHEAFAEEAWRSFKINGVRFEHLKRCGRCVLSTINPETGEINPKAQPLLFLKKNRKGSYPWMTEDSKYFSKEGFFAVNIRHLDQGILRVGDTVAVHSSF